MGNKKWDESVLIMLIKFEDIIKVLNKRYLWIYYWIFDWNLIEEKCYNNSCWSGSVSWLGRVYNYSIEWFELCVYGWEIYRFYRDF